MFNFSVAHNRSPEKQRQLSRQLERLGSVEQGSILVDFGSSGRSRLYIEPKEWVTATEAEEVGPALVRIEELRQEHRLVGWFGYELGYLLEPAFGSPPQTLEPYFEFGVFDHFETALGEEYQEEEFQISNGRMELDEKQYRDGITCIHDAIRRGEVYQVNFTTRYRFNFEGDPRSLFLSLGRSQPVAYGAVLRHGDHWILSLSPELFFEANGQVIKSVPMKGTISRGRSTQEDQALGRELFEDPKSRAENLMIVDLIRNDLGRICRTGSIDVESLFDVQRLPTLLQMTSTVQGRLKEKTELSDVLKALFPCGSITGAPKISAMNLIRELEPSPRGVYCGAIGSITADRLIFNVAIRTLTLKAEAPGSNRFDGVLGIGSGVVIDSDAEAEWQECRLKSHFLIKRSPSVSLIESLLFDGTYHRREMHLDRMEDSADYFGIRFQRNDAEQALRAAVGDLGLATAKYKVRLELSEIGRFRVEATPISSLPLPVRLGISRTRVDRRDVYLHHKTSHRELYDRAQCAARVNGLWDILFLNNEGEVTEGSICNLFVRTGTEWWTPPLGCGLLPGVMRAEAVTQLKARERPFGLEELLAAEEVRATNSVRGMVEAILCTNCLDLDLSLPVD